LWCGCSFFLLASFDSALNTLVGGGGAVITDASFLIAAIVAFAAFLAGSLFLGWSLFLLLTNQSTIEFYGNTWGPKPGNPYNLGAWKNISAVLGDAWLAVMIFPSLALPPGDGIIFALNDGRGLPLPMLIDERAA
jgi:palmitoyltransferase